MDIPSDVARGGVEMAMLSLITKKVENRKIYIQVLKEYSEKIISIDGIFKSFYEEYVKDNPCKVKKLKNLVIECFNQLNSKIAPELNEEALKRVIQKYEF